MGTDKTGRSHPGYLFFTVAGILYLFVHLIAALSPSPLLWGVDGWCVLPTGVPYLLFILGVVLFIPRVDQPIVRGFRVYRRISARAPRIVWLTAAGILFWVFRKRTFFLGDALLRMRNVTLHQEYGYTFPRLSWEKPLDTFLHSGLYNLLHPLTGITAQDVYQGVSILAGIAMVWAIMRYLGRLFDSHGVRLTAGMVILTTGTIELFFGYVESYTIAWLFVLLSLLTGLAMIREQRFSPLSACFFILAAAFHFVTLSVAPGIVYAYVLVIRRSTPPAERLRRWGLLTLIAILVWGGTAFLLEMGAHPLSGYFTVHTTGLIFLPLFGESGTYTILSPGHLIDLANELILLVPAGVVLFLGSWQAGKLFRSARVRFLVLSCLGPALILVLIDPKLGFARDWDLFSLFAIPAALFIGELIALLPENLLKRIAVPLTAVCVLNTVPWVLINASEQASLARFERLAVTPHWPASAKDMAFESLGTYYAERSRYNEAAEQDAAAYDHTGNIRFYRNVIAMYQRSGDFDALGRFVRSHGNIAEGYFNLGMAYLSRGRVDVAIPALEKAVELDPDYPDGYLNLGIGYGEAGRNRDA
ncbi:tetratricopeptide repeat protein, partial [Candidatus Latescibacterota bacterium]